MATIDNLNISITQMTRPQAESLILERRKNLRVIKPSKQNLRAMKTEAKTKAKTTLNLISSLTPDQRKQLLEELGAS